MILRVRDHLSTSDLRAEIWVVAKRPNGAAACSRLTGAVFTSLHAVSSEQVRGLSMPIEHRLKLFFCNAVIALGATTVYPAAPPAVNRVPLDLGAGAPVAHPAL